jgi:hypothetical protein
MTAKRYPSARQMVLLGRPARTLGWERALARAAWSAAPVPWAVLASIRLRLTRVWGNAGSACARDIPSAPECTARCRPTASSRTSALDRGNDGGRRGGSRDRPTVLPQRWHQGVDTPRRPLAVHTTLGPDLRSLPAHAVGGRTPRKARAASAVGRALPGSGATQWAGRRIPSGALRRSSAAAPRTLHARVPAPFGDRRGVRVRPLGFGRAARAALVDTASSATSAVASARKTCGPDGHVRHRATGRGGRREPARD